MFYFIFYCLTHSSQAEFWTRRLQGNGCSPVLDNDILNFKKQWLKANEMKHDVSLHVQCAVQYFQFWVSVELSLRNSPKALCCTLTLETSTPTLRMASKPRTRTVIILFMPGRYPLYFKHWALLESVDLNSFQKVSAFLFCSPPFSTVLLHRFSTVTEEKKSILCLLYSSLLTL